MWRGDAAPGAFQAPVDVHASADGQVFVFKRRPNEGSSDDEEPDLVEMRPRGSLDQNRPRNLQLLERKLQDGDNLNKLALKYGCKVSDLKRVNNLLQDQDLFALKSIKIPVLKHGFLTETLSEPSEEELPDLPPPLDLVQPPRSPRASDFLMELDSDMEKLIPVSGDPEELSLQGLETEPGSGSRGRSWTGHGSDWGIQWWNAVAAMLLIGIVLPLFYVIYFKTRSSGGDDDGDGALVSPLNHSASAVGVRGLKYYFTHPG